ncbi:zinc-binding dehydrogenase [Streptococcus oricebi]|uniref:Quinone oxidoreductase n=1 Tax=Streptococcus oricebi TaxID=1547447 RepID=A0ABS5B2K4_9STRE|nr:zinc-binding dehydrogenase [Streptococcus oricebi]MBP2623049.1 quinone oxidoreductase [Streptococcus oricebi]
MKAILVSQAGGPEVLEYKELALPSMKKGWSLVKVKGFGLNRSEIFTRQGLSPSVKFPRILGIECVGEIVESEHFPKEQTIVSIMGEMGRAFDGSYAEYVLLPDHQIYPVETNLSWADLAAVPESFYTVYGSMKNLHIKEDDRVLVRAATSAAGMTFVRLLRACFPDLVLVASTQNQAKEEQLLSAGYSQVVLDKDGQLQTEQTFTKILELVGPKTIKNSLQHLEEEGILCSVGQLGGQWYLDEFDPIVELANNVYLTTFYSGNVSQEKINEMFAYIDKYQVPVAPAHVFSLKEVPQAHALIESGQTKGKVVVVLEKEDKDDE